MKTYTCNTCGASFNHPHHMNNINRACPNCYSPDFDFSAPDGSKIAMIVLLFMAVIGLGVTKCSAEGDWRLDVNLASHHFNAPPAGLDEFNEINPGLGAEYITPDGMLFFAAGFYDNSFEEISRYAGIGMNLYQIPRHTLGFELAIADGYENVDFDNRVYCGPDMNQDPAAIEACAQFEGRGVIAFPGFFWKPQLTERGYLKLNYSKEIVTLQFQYDL